MPQPSSTALQVPDEPLVVYILGAGASLTAGLPLAHDFPGAAREYLERLTSSEQANVDRIAHAVKTTLRHLANTRSETIDELAYQLDDRNALDQAKICTEAVIYDIEQRSSSDVYADYHKFLINVCLTSPLASRPRQLRSNIRVLTFNYDRCLEIAYSMITQAARLNDAVSTSVQKPALARCHYYSLNSGFQDAEGFLIEPGRFAYLKMHGSVGIRLPTRDPHIKYHLWPPSGRPLDDSVFWHNGRNAVKSRSLIAFPAEKQEVGRRSIQRSYFHNYIAAIHSEAVAVMKRASEVHISGYSATNRQQTRFEDLLKAVPLNCGIVIHDPSELVVDRIRRIVPERQVAHRRTNFAHIWRD